jgi:Uncharacterized conserved protein containing a ferredoxin-like domain
MKIGLFIPCFIDAFFPEVGIATLQLLERFDLDVVYPPDQTCCGQPMANSGFHADAVGAEALFARNFGGFDYVVGPSGSCVHHIRDHFTAVEQTAAVVDIRARTYELVEFLHDILKVDAFPWARFPHKVGLHNSCGPLRGLRHARASELREPYSRSRSRFCPRSMGSNSWRRRGPTSAAASGAFFRLQRSRVGEDGLRQGPGFCAGQGRLHRLGRQFLPYAPARLRRARQRPDKIHPYRADLEWSRGMSNLTPEDRPDSSKIEPQPRGARHKGSRPINQAEAAERFLAAPRHQKQHDNRLWTLRQRRDEQMWAMPEWEEMRSLASEIKEHTLSHLDTYLEMFEANAKANGVVVHWAKDAAEHNRIVLDVLERRGAKTLIKSKSMLHRGMRVARRPGESRGRGDRDGSRRAYPAA